MGQAGDMSAEKPQAPADVEDNKAPMAHADISPGSAGGDNIADEAIPEDATTQIVPRATPTSPAAASSRRNGSSRPAGTPAAPPAAARPNQLLEQGQGNPHVVPVVGGQQRDRPAQPTHAPFHTASSWGPTTFVITAETAAGFSYLFWWISGLLVYFNERENRYVRFHAVQSILLTGVLSVFGVFAFLITAILNTFFLTSHLPIWQALAQGIAALSLFVVLFVWLAAMIAAWTGHYIKLPTIGDYAEQFAAPPILLRP